MYKSMNYFVYLHPHMYFYLHVFSLCMFVCVYKYRVRASVSWSARPFLSYVSFPLDLHLFAHSVGVDYVARGCGPQVMTARMSSCLLAGFILHRSSVLYHAWRENKVKCTRQRPTLTPAATGSLQSKTTTIGTLGPYGWIYCEKEPGVLVTHWVSSPAVPIAIIHRSMASVHISFPTYVRIFGE